MRITILAAIILCLISLAGCAMHIEDYQDTKPAFVPEEYFTKPHTAYGQFIDRTGEVKEQFVVQVKGTWDKQRQTLQLHEDFSYADGKKLTRVWTLKKQDAHSYEATATDIPGKHTARVYGQALQMRYGFPLKYKGHELNVTLNDWMWLQPGGEVVLNRTRMSKFGINLGELIISFHPQDGK